MAITGISRDQSLNVCIVRMTSTDNISVCSAAGYITDQEDNINEINHGVWLWLANDTILLAASDGDEFFSISSDFSSLLPLGSGEVGFGTINSVAYYPATGTSVVGLGTANNGVLATNSSGVPSISSTLPFTVTVPYGGTGNTTFTAYSIICAGTTATGTFQNVVGVGTSGQILKSNGASALPSWQTDTSSGTVNTGGANQLAYYVTNGDAVSGLSSANNGTLVTSNTGVPSILGGPGVSGRFLQSNTAAAPSFTSVSYPTSVVAAGKIIISDGSNWVASTSFFPNTVGSAGKILRSDGTSNVYSTSTFADTYTASNILYSNGANTVTGLSTANSAVLITNSSGVPSWSGTMTDGQVIIGSTASTPTAATLTAGTNISITNGAASITIASTGFASFSWNTVTTDTAVAINNGYYSNSASQLNFTLPAIAVVGSLVKIRAQGTGGFSVIANTGQTIKWGNQTTSSAGSWSTASQNDTIDIECMVANTTWIVTSAISQGMTVA